MSNPIASAKKFVKRNERRILISTTVIAITTCAVMRVGIKQHDEFLKEHGLLDAYYNSED